MTQLEIIRARRSVRSFDGRALSEADRAQILDAARSAANPYGIAIDWQLLDAKAERLSSPVITGTDCYIAGKLARQAHAEEAFGYSFERVVLRAAALGVGSTWIAGTLDRPAFERAMKLAQGEVMPCVSPLGYPAEKMSLRESMMRRGVKADSRLPFEGLFFARDFSAPLSPVAAGSLADALEAVRLAPSAVNKQPWRAVVDGAAVHFYEKKSKGLGSPVWDIQKIDLGIALCHFAAVAAETRGEPVFEIADPGLPHDADCAYIASFRFD